MNNYDTSSTGENIDFCVFYNIDLAQIYFDEWLNGADGTKITDIRFGRDCNLFLIGESEAPYYSKKELQKMSKQTLFELMLNYDLLSYNAELNDFKKSEYIADLLNVTYKRHYERLCSEYNWHGIKENIQHNFYISRGYSQGEAVIIVFLDSENDNDNYRKYLDNIFWDCPITIRAEINGREYCEDDFLSDDFYEWNREDIKARVMAWNDCSDYAKNWIIEHLPEYPDYS